MRSVREYIHRFEPGYAHWNHRYQIKLDSLVLDKLEPWRGTHQEQHGLAR